MERANIRVSDSATGNGLVSTLWRVPKSQRFRCMHLSLNFPAERRDTTQRTIPRVSMRESKSPQVGAGAFWQALGRGAFKDKIFDAQLPAIFALAPFVTVFVHGINIRF